VPVVLLGRVGGGRLTVSVGGRVRVDIGVDALADAFEQGLVRSLEGERHGDGPVRA
jgi:hypothetical protein